jgi:hypothetical protein
MYVVGYVAYSAVLILPLRVTDNPNVSRTLIPTRRALAMADSA